MSANGRLHTLILSSCVKHNDNKGTYSDVCHDWHHSWSLDPGTASSYLLMTGVPIDFDFVTVNDKHVDHSTRQKHHKTWDHLSILFSYSHSSSTALWNKCRFGFMTKLSVEGHTQTLDWKPLGFVRIGDLCEVQAATKHNTTVNIGGGKNMTMVNYERRIHYHSTQTKQQPEGGRGNER